MTNTISTTDPNDAANTRLLRAIEQQLHESEIGFQLDKARLYGATTNPSPNVEDPSELFASIEKVYGVPFFKPPITIGLVVLLFSAPVLRFFTV